MPLVRPTWPSRRSARLASDQAPATPLPAARWRTLATGLLLGLGALGVGLGSHLDSRTAAYFASWQRLPTSSLPNGLALADDDDDGDLDLWVGHEQDHTLWHYRNEGAGRFVPAGRWPSVDGMRICLPDLNEDGRPDPVVFSLVDTAVCCHLSGGPRQWGPKQTLWQGAASFDGWAGDLDGDHHADLLVASRRNSRTVLLFGDGHGRFPAHQFLAANTHVLGVLGGDVDGDGDADVLLATPTATHIGHCVRLYRNQGHRRFVHAADLPVSDSPQRLALADVDGDGDPDLLVTAYTASQVDVCLNDGRGTFGPAQPWPTGPQPFALAAADLDADGDCDVLTTSAATRSVYLLRNQGRGRFAAPVAFAVGATPTGLAVGDLDGDGQPDAVTTDYADHQLTLLRHARPPLVWWPLQAALLLGLVGAAGYAYLRRHQRENDLRTRLAADLHDELGGLLTRVTLRAELLETQHPLPELANLVQDSRQAAATMRDVIWSVDTRADTVAALLDRLHSLVEGSRPATAQHLQLHAALPATLHPAQLRATVRQHTYLVGKEALTNALKHGLRQGPVSITLRIQPHELQLVVENDAPVGAPEGRDGHGLRNMRARAAAIGGELHAGSQGNGRWQVLLRVPGPLQRGWHLLGS
ncbi:MAG: FG-GAP-like repeat-containing protein [Janthinobacterium lividum]